MTEERVVLEVAESNECWLYFEESKPKVTHSIFKVCGELYKGRPAYKVNNLITLLWKIEND